MNTQQQNGSNLHTAYIVSRTQDTTVVYVCFHICYIVIRSLGGHLRGGPLQEGFDHETDHELPRTSLLWRCVITALGRSCSHVVQRHWLVLGRILPSLGKALCLPPGRFHGLAPVHTFLEREFPVIKQRFRSALSRIPHTILPRIMRYRRSPKLEVTARRRTSPICRVRFWLSLL